MIEMHYQPSASARRMDVLMHSFIQWLATEGILTEWMDGVLDDAEGSDINLSRKTNSFRRDYDEIITNSFGWAMQPHGVPWVSLHEEWRGVALQFMREVDRKNYNPYNREYTNVYPLVHPEPYDG